jgi:hypothetical protein
MLTVLSATLGTILGVTIRSTTLPAKKTCHPSGKSRLRYIREKFELILRKICVKIEKKLKKVRKGNAPPIRYNKVEKSLRLV